MIVFAFVSALALAGCGPRHAPGELAAARAVRGAVRPSAAIERDVFDLVNRHRRERGLAALVLDARIGRQARLHSAAMATGATAPGHAGFDERVRLLRREMSCRRTAENVAFNQGYRDPASQAVRGWLGSRGHRENIEGPYQSTGIGVASAKVIVPTIECGMLIGVVAIDQGKPLQVRMAFAVFGARPAALAAIVVSALLIFGVEAWTAYSVAGINLLQNGDGEPSMTIGTLASVFATGTLVSHPYP
jgi:hypothetical protein